MSSVSWRRLLLNNSDRCQDWASHASCLQILMSYHLAQQEESWLVGSTIFESESLLPLSNNRLPVL